MVEAQVDNRTYMTRRAYGLGVFNGIVFSMGWAFVEPTTVLPAFVSRLTDSTILIGLISFIGLSGWNLPQLLAAGWIQHQPYKRPNYILTTAMRAAGWLVAIPVIYLCAGHSNGLALLGFFLGYSLFSFAGGLGGPAFMEIVAKTVAPNRLGSFFANREFWGALGGIGCGSIIHAILASPALTFPGNYSLLFIIALGLFIPGWVAFASVKEPPSLVVEAQSPRDFLRSTRDCLYQDHGFRQLVVARMLLGATVIASPFYILYCRQMLHLPDAAVGTYVSLQMAGAVSANQVWGRLSDRRNPHAVIVAVAILSFIGPGVALLAAFLPFPQTVSRILFGIAFFTLGATGGGAFIGFTNYMLAIAPEERRTLYIGVFYTITALPTFLPLLGGVIAVYTSFRVIFALAACFSIAGAAMVFRLPPCERSQGPEDV